MQPGYNTTETSTSLWVAALNAPESTGKSRGRTKKSEMISHPEFEEAAQYTDDQFWADILRRCARKKFPRGFSYADGQLRHRPNEIAIVLPDDPAARTLTMIYFFQENGKLYSKKDQENRRLREEEADIARLATASSSWKCISYSKNRRATHVSDYVERKYRHLTKSIRDELYTQIEVGFDTKFITKDHVQFENGQILYIDGLDANENGVIFTRPIPDRPLAFATRNGEPKNETHRHLDGWLKYLDNYTKYIYNSAKATYTTIHTSDSGYYSGMMSAPPSKSDPTSGLPSE